MIDTTRMVCELGRQAAAEAGTCAVRSRGASFETVYQEYLAGVCPEHQTYSRPTALYRTTFVVKQCLSLER